MNKDYEIEKIKGEELGKQMIDDRLKGKHTRLEIVIGEDKTPIVNLNNKGNGIEGMKMNKKRKFDILVLRYSINNIIYKCV